LNIEVKPESDGKFGLYVNGVLLATSKAQFDADHGKQILKAAVAQMVEQRTCNAKVGGSIPSSGSTCQIASEKTEGRFYCTRKPGHDGPCATVLALCADTDPERDCKCGGERGKSSCMFPGASAEQEAVSKATDAGSTPAAPATFTIADGTRGMQRGVWPMQDLTKRDHLPEGSY
jgi:hypothetical protein